MKIRTITLLLCAVCTYTSCSQSKSDSDNQKETSMGEDFNSFLVDFNKKPTFQRQRVLFPMEATVLDPSEFGMQTVSEEITYQDWHLLDFSYDSTFVTRQMDSYEQTIRIYNDSCIIEQRGVNNGIFANFYFTKKDGKWYLKSYTDISY